MHLTYQKQRGSRQTVRRLNRWTIGLALLVSAFISVVTLLMALADPLMFRNPPPLRADWLAQLSAVLALYTLFVHFMVIGRTLGLATTSVTHRTGGAWDNIVITGIDARRLVRGKWIALIRLMWRDYAILAALRCGVTLGLATTVLNNDSLGEILYWVQPTIIPNLPGRMLLACVLIVALTLLNCLFTAGAATLGSFLARSNTSGITTLFTTRLTALGIPLALSLIPGLYAITQQPITDPALEELFEVSFIVFGFGVATLIDNGTFAAIGVAGPRFFDVPFYFGGGLLGLTTVSVVTLLLLHISQWIVARQGVLPTLRRHAAA